MQASCPGKIHQLCGVHVHMEECTLVKAYSIFDKVDQKV